MARNEKAATLMIYGKTGDGKWRRGSIVWAKNNRVKIDVMEFQEEVVPVNPWQYTIRYYEDGQPQYLSVGTDYEKAESLLQSFKDQQRVKDLQERGLIAKPLEEAKTDRKTLAELVQEYIAEKESPSLNLSLTAIRHYRDTLNEFLKAVKRDSISEVTEADVISFIDTLRKRYSKKSCVMAYTVVRGFLRNNGVAVERLIKNANHRRLAAKPEAEVIGYSEDELRRLFNAAKDDLYYTTIFKFLLYTGLRYREANHLTWANLDFKRWVITVKGGQEVTRKYRNRVTGAWVTKVVKSKTKSGKSREVPIFPSLRPWLTAWREKNPERVFVFGSKRSDMPDNHWLFYLHKFAAAAKVEGATLHRFRHTFGLTCADNNMPIHRLSKIMGHHSVTITMQYLHHTNVEVEVDPFATKAA